MTHIGFIGLGHMGAPMARNLLAAGFPVTVYDVDPAAVAALESHGAVAASDVGTCCAEADALITMLPGPAQVRDVLVGDGGALAALRGGAVAIDMSTSSTAVGREVLEAARRHDVAVLDAPVAGMAAGAHAGTLSIFVGGDDDVLATVRPVLEAMGDPARIFHVGGHGAGYGVKLLLNLLWFMHAVAAAEVLTIGARAGIDLAVLRTALINSPANSNFLEHDVLSVLRDGDYDDAFAMRLVTKDLGLAVDMARDVGVPVEMAALVEQIHRRARARYGDAAGEMSAVRLYEDLAGLQLRLQEVAHVG